MPVSQVVDRIGTAILLLVAIGAMAILAVHLFGSGIDRMLYSWSTRIVDPATGKGEFFLGRAHIDLVAVPLAAIAAARLRWGADWIAAPRALRAIRVGPRWGEGSTPPPRASRALPLLPWLGAAVLFGVICYWGGGGTTPTISSGSTRSSVCSGGSASSSWRVSGTSG